MTAGLAFVDMANHSLASTGNPTIRLISQALDPITIVQRVTDPDTADPVVSGGQLIRHDFANDQSLGLGQPNRFDSATGSTSFSDDGLRLSFGLTGGGYIIGSASYYEEGILRLEGPHMFPYILGQHANTSQPVGRLEIVDDNGTPRFQWSQYQILPSNQVESYLFDDPAAVVPLSNGAQGLPPTYFHYAFRKSGGSINLYLNGSLVQTISPVPQSDPNDPGAVGDHFFGGSSNGNIFVSWWRSIGSHSVSSGSASPVSAPALYTQEDYSPDGSFAPSYFDGGQDDLYWNLLDVFQTGQFPLIEAFGSDLQVRWVATNDAPAAGNLDASFSGPFVDMVPSQPINDMGNPQGRYLLVQLRFIPSPTVLQGVPARIFSQNLRCVWNDQPWPGAQVDPVPLTVLGEPASSGTLPVTPHFPDDAKKVYRTVRSQKTAPYTVTYAMDSVGRRSGALNWPAISTAERDALETFFDDIMSKTLVFDAELPNGTSIKYHYMSQSFSWRKIAGAVYSASCEVQEVFS